MKAKERQELFSHMSNEHGLHLLENELDEIERILGDKREYAKAKAEEAIEIVNPAYIEKGYLKWVLDKIDFE